MQAGVRDLTEAFARADVEQSLATRFEAQVDRRPDQIALRFGERAVTYAALDAWSNRVAHALSGAGGTVALLCDHGPPALAAALGVLKAARCYVPLPLDHPIERHATVAADAEASVVLTDDAGEAVARLLAERVPLAVVNVERLDGPSTRPRTPPAAPRDRCCILYTSGSTGRPKGVVQLHRNILFGAWCYTTLGGFGPHDRLSWLQSLGTIAGTTAWCAALLNGGTLCPFVPGRDGLDALLDWIAAERLTVLHVVPTLFRRLVHRLPAARRLDGLRLLRLGGEPVTATEVALFRAHCPPSCRLVLGLGSTEAGNFRTSIYDAATLPDEPVLPAGDPVPERIVALVDEAGRPVPPGAVGEIIVTSEYLFEGYWRQPELTAAVLSPDPDDPRRRRFRTGDLGRMAADGRLYHVGRVDAQVKIAGQRIETAEVECALRALPAVRDAAVVADASAALSAFVVAAPGTTLPPARALRASLRRVLPVGMVPARIVALDALPVLPGGKVDRVALRARAATRAARWVAPRNPVEETVAALWARALALSDVGADDDFLHDLGGDSLAAVEILSAAETVFGRALSLDAFADARTVAAFAVRLVGPAWSPPADGLLSLHADGPQSPLFALCGAYGHALRLLLIAHRLGASQPFHALQPPGMDWEAAGCRTVEAMAAHYAGVVRRLQPHGPYRLLGTSVGGTLMFEVARRLERDGAAVAWLAMVDTLPPDCRIGDDIDRAVRRDWAADVDPGDRLVAAGARVARAHRAAFDAYLLDGTIAAPVLYFLCADAPVPDEGDRRLLWREFTRGGLTIVRVPGLHGDFHRDPQCAAVADALARAVSAGPGA